MTEGHHDVAKWLVTNGIEFITGATGHYPNDGLMTFFVITFFCV